MKKFVKRWKIKNLILCNLLFSNLLYAQSPTANWLDISLIDAAGYVLCYAENTTQDYPYSNLFDGSFKTCWVAGSETAQSNPSLYLRLPKTDVKFFNLFSGYGKNHDLYRQNARPRKIKLSIYAALNPQGYVSEISLLYKAKKFPHEKIIEIADTFLTRQIALDFPRQELSDFLKEVKKQFIADFNQPVSDACLILQVEILESWPGDKYEDICLSELFFSDRFVSSYRGKPIEISKVYLNDDENELLTDNKNQTHIITYKDVSSVLQIIDISKDNKWVILISMPAEIDGRVETSYLLVDILNHKIVNQDLEAATGNYIDGSPIYLDYDKQGALYLEYSTFDNGDFKIYLK